MEQMNIYELVSHCTNYLKKIYSETTLHDYQSVWRNGIVKFMKEKGLTTYSTELGEQYISQINDNIKFQTYNSRLRKIQVLNDYLSDGRIHFCRQRSVPIILNGVWSKYLRDFMTYYKSLRRNEKTIKEYRVYISHFFYYLGTIGIEQANEIKDIHILRYIGNLDKISNSVSALRGLFHFWQDRQITQNDLSSALGLYRYADRREKIPSFYSPEEIKAIEESVNRTTIKGKRDYAMLLLSTRLGLRVSDIAGLKFEHIHWKENQIVFHQYKTKNLISLPLLTNVGNALIDYLKHARKDSKSDNIFLELRSPYIESSRAMVCGAIGRIIATSGVKIGDRHHGAHAMRHSLASNMLRKGTTLPVITEALGHAQSQSTMKYLKIDIRSLFQCALSVGKVSDEFYNQKGGAFYV